MWRLLVKLIVGCACVSTLLAQDFKLFNYDVQVHGFASQGYVKTDGNNWLTMNSGDGGSGQFTDFGGNASVQITDKFRIGAQIYDRNLGQLGKWHPELDWAVATYTFKPWFGIRGGKVKTVMGLYNDTQDQDFLHTFALLPQGIYPTDVRDATLAHEGGDLFGDIAAGKKGGTLSYTAYAGHREDSRYGGYAYLLGPTFNRLSGLQYGADLRWATPLKGLLAGISRLDEDASSETGAGTPSQTIIQSKSMWTNQYYAQYTRKKLGFDSEFRRYYFAGNINGGSAYENDVRAWYFAGSYQIVKHLQVGSYYSHYFITVPPYEWFGTLTPNQTGHDYDKVVTARIDFNRFFVVKVEGHFMDGYGLPWEYPNGFYNAVNPQGLKPNTNALVVKASFKF